MMRVVIQRLKSSDEGTPGFLSVVGGTFKCATWELDWVDLDGNGKRDRGLSRVKAGIYLCAHGPSPSRKLKDGSPESTYRLKDVPDADGVLIHSGNFGGRKDRGYVTDIEGCILLGADHDLILIQEPKRTKAGVTRTHQRGVTASRITVAAFEDFTKREPFELEIRDYVA